MNYNKNYFDKIDSNNKAYFLGFIHADGYISKDFKKKYNKYYYIFRLRVHECDGYILERLQKEMESKIEAKYITLKTNKGNYKQCVFKIANKHLVERLIEIYGGDLKDKRLFIPKEIKYNKEYLRHYIRGYFDGDGSISKNEVSISGRYEFLKDLKSTINLKENITNMKSIYRIRLRKKDSIKWFLNYIYGNLLDEDIFIHRKKELADKYLL